MSITISDYINVRQRISELGCIEPSGIALLPSNFESASQTSGFRQESQSDTIRTLLRASKIPLDEILEKDLRPPYIQNNSFEWVAPTIFITLGLLSDNPNHLSLTLSIIANYATDFFKGMNTNNNVKMDIVVESSKSKVCKKISYTGPADGLRELPEVIRAASNEK